MKESIYDKMTYAEKEVASELKRLGIHGRMNNRCLYGMKTRDHGCGLQISIFSTLVFTWKYAVLGPLIIRIGEKSLI